MGQVTVSVTVPLPPLIPSGLRAHAHTKPLLNSPRGTLFCCAPYPERNNPGVDAAPNDESFSGFGFAGDDPEYELPEQQASSDGLYAVTILEANL